MMRRQGLDDKGDPRSRTLTFNFSLYPEQYRFPNGTVVEMICLFLSLCEFHTRRGFEEGGE